MNNLEKYLKYKTKYLKLKSQYGGLNKSSLDIETVQFYTVVDDKGETQKFKFIKNLGEGTSGTVSLIQNIKTLENCIIKISTKEDDGYNSNILQEAEFLEDLNKHVTGSCSYKAHYYGNINGKNLAYLISDYLGQDLFIKNRDLEPNLIPSIIDKIINCVIELNKYIYHRDLKMDNIMIDDSNNIKIIDFGLSTKIDDPEDRQHLGYVSCPVERIFRFYDGQFNLLEDPHIKTSVDYYGLFWIIINLICKTEVFYNFFKSLGYKIKYSFDSKEYQIVLNFYLDILKSQINLSDEYILKLINTNMYRKYQTPESQSYSLDLFIDYCINQTSKDVLTKLFYDDKNKLKEFIKNLVDLLLNFDPRKRASLIDVRAFLTSFFFPPPPPNF